MARYLVMLSLAARSAALYAPRAASLRLVRCAASRAERELELWRKTVPMLKDELRAQGLKVGGKKAELVERLLGPGEIEDELDCDVPMAVTAMSPTVLIEACRATGLRPGCREGAGTGSKQRQGRRSRGKASRPQNPCPSRAKRVPRDSRAGRSSPGHHRGDGTEPRPFRISTLVLMKL